MAEFALPADVEALVFARIGAVFASVPEMAGVKIATRIPGDVPSKTKEFARIWGSNPLRETPVTYSWFITLEGWAATETRAQRILAWMAAALDDVEGDLFGVRFLGGAGNNPHPDYSTLFRYSGLAEVRARSQIVNV